MANKKKRNLPIPIGKSKKPKPALPVDESKLPKELADLWGSVQATAKAFHMLQEGMFHHSKMEEVRHSLQYLRLLHRESINAACRHADADMIPELKDEKKRQADEAKKLAKLSREQPEQGAVSGQAH